MFLLSPLIKTRRRPLKTTKSAIHVNSFPSIQYFLPVRHCHVSRWKTAAFPLVSSEDNCLDCLSKGRKRGFDARRCQTSSSIADIAIADTLCSAFRSLFFVSLLTLSPSAASSSSPSPSAHQGQTSPPRLATAP
jgi:hypothetical protein